MEMPLPWAELSFLGAPHDIGITVRCLEWTGVDSCSHALLIDANFVT